MEANNLRVMCNRVQSGGVVHPLLKDLEHKEMVSTKKLSNIPLVTFDVSVLIHPQVAGTAQNCIYPKAH